MAAIIELESGFSVAASRLQDLSKRFPALAVLEYLSSLFEDSPKELFTRIDILTVLDIVKKDRLLFPETVVAMWDRMKASKSTPTPGHRARPAVGVSLTLGSEACGSHRRGHRKDLDAIQLG